MTVERELILMAFDIERDRQIELGFTPEHDDEHTLAELLGFIRERLDALPGSETLDSSEHPFALATNEVFTLLVQVGALTVAALERVNRKGTR